MTIIVWFHMSGYKTFKDYYTREACNHLRWDFPSLVSYDRFVELMSDALILILSFNVSYIELTLATEIECKIRGLHGAHY